MVIKSGISSGECAKPVTGRPIPLRESNCSERNLSLERVIETLSLSTWVPIISNWRNTAQP